MIKQIQLRGITRNPSDRQTPDGGCAESINAYLDENETAPAPKVNPVSDDVYGHSVVKAPIKYIHKLPAGGEIYLGITMATSNPDQWRVFAYKDGTMQLLTSLLQYEPKQFASIGNTLIIYTNTQPYYYLFKEGAYIELGSEIPRPKVEVIAEDYDIVDWSFGPYEVTINGGLGDGGINITRWQNAKIETNSYHDALLETINNFWDKVQEKIHLMRTIGAFSAPFFIRYALRLYDDKYIYCSTPILCANARKWNDARTSTNSIANYNWAEGKLTYTNGDPACKLYLDLNQQFLVKLKGSYDIGNWSDIVRSIDIFASTPIYTPLISAVFSDVVATSTGTPLTSAKLVFDKMEADMRDKTIRDEILSKGQFYKVKSFDVKDANDMSKLGEGTALENSEKLFGDILVTQQVLPDDYRDGNVYIPKNGTLNFNNRVMLVGASERLTRGDMFLNGLALSHPEGSYDNPESQYYVRDQLFSFKLRYKVFNPANGEVNYVMANYRNNGNMLYPGYFYRHNTAARLDEYMEYGNVFHENEKAYEVTLPYAWLCYPDTRCTQVEVFCYDHDGTFLGGKVIPMEKHPLLECAYAYLGYGNSLMDICTDSQSPYADATETEVENRSMSADNKIFLSNFENPFLYSPEGIISFNDNVIGVAITSVPLSEGQLGDFDVYVFTADGIRVLGTNSEGTFSTKIVPPNIARHVALPGTILGIEQIIVFTTERGVMLISGSTVQCISNLMNGRHWMIDDGLPNNDKLTTYINGWTGYSSVSAALSDNSTFMEFMKQAKVAYDYNGRRLLFCKEGVGYYYTYMLDTATWHKMISQETSRTILNSFPECLMASVVNSVGVVYDYSTVLDSHSILSDTGNVRYSLIATRPLDLGEPDIRKAIKDLRVRGRYNDKTDVKYVLLGSMDGTNWNILRTLRGGSFKWFRIVLLCGLSPTERITWIDVDFETRFANRLR